MLDLKLKQYSRKHLNQNYTPEKYCICDNEDSERLNDLIDRKKEVIVVNNTIREQLSELLIIRDLSLNSVSPSELDRLVDEYIEKQGSTESTYGNWFYYSWSEKLVHLLPEEEFIELRTSRNKYKITDAEQKLLHKKKIGVIGLSVGNSVAHTLAMERVCSELRLADFDDLQLSNLNRLRATVSDIGLPKSVITARQIAEIDPYIKISLFAQGVFEHNILEFYGDGEEKLDIVVDVCDTIPMKFLIREEARRNRIAVVMDTNDRGMLDIERYDLEKDREIFHGYTSDYSYASIRDLVDRKDIIKVAQKIVDINTLSERMQASFVELGRTINSWPQLASGVNLGGAITADICRRILLDNHKTSGRFFVDLDKIFHDIE